MKRKRFSIKKLILLVTMLMISVGYIAGLGRMVAASSLWLGNDTHGDVFQTDTTGAILQQIPNLPVTGIAFDGTYLYFSDRSASYTQRTADGGTVLNSFFIPASTGEDLAWDTRRQRLWEVDHRNALRMINPATGLVEASYALPTVHTGFNTLGALGIAYDSNRDLLYASFCERGCANLTQGLVQIVDPNNGNVLADLFTTAGFATGGLGYDPIVDTLWVGDSTVVRNMTRGGAVISSFIKPQPSGFTDGLEYISAVPEPSILLLLGSGLAGLAVFRRKLGRRKG